MSQCNVELDSTSSIECISINTDMIQDQILTHLQCKVSKLSSANLLRLIGNSDASCNSLSRSFVNILIVTSANIWFPIGH